jgi:hypothetical protein
LISPLTVSRSTENSRVFASHLYKAGEGEPYGLVIEELPLLRDIGCDRCLFAIPILQCNKCGAIIDASMVKMRWRGFRDTVVLAIALSVIAAFVYFLFFGLKVLQWSY